MKNRMNPYGRKIIVVSIIDIYFMDDFSVTSTCKNHNNKPSVIEVIITGPVLHIKLPIQSKSIHSYT